MTRAAARFYAGEAKLEPYIGEIKLLPWEWAPKNWHVCDGALLPINQYSALFSLLGVQYGGDGRTNFALPDLRGRAPIHFGATHQQGAKDGAETVTLLPSQLPAHNHMLVGTSQAGQKFIPAGALSQIAPTTAFAYAPDTTTLPLNPGCVLPAGSGGPHSNMQPYLVLNYCIALFGVYPARN
jgi:microcystin-dependent protein